MFKTSGRVSFLIILFSVSSVLCLCSTFLVIRVRTDLEKSLKMTFVLENSWNSKKVQFVFELSLNYEKTP